MDGSYQRRTVTMVAVVFKKYPHLVLLYASLLHCIFIQGCPTNLINIVVYAGNSTSFSQKDNQVVKWQVASSSKSENSLMDITPDYDNTVDAQFFKTYAVNNSQLTIFEATGAPQGNMPYSTAGLYLLNYEADDCITAAALVVIVRGPNCTCTVSDTNKVQMSCSVSFAHYVKLQINPIMTWIHDATTVFQESPQPISTELNNPGLQTVTSTYSPPYLDGTPYEFRLTFTGPDTSCVPPFVDPHPPNFTASYFLTDCVTTTNSFTKIITTA